MPNKRSRVKLTDKERKQIVAVYVETQNYSETARRCGVNEKTVRKHVKSDTGMVEKAEQKKAENTADILAYMETRKGQVCDVIGKIITAMNDPSTIADASLRELATTFGILYDKFIPKDAMIDKKDNGLLADFNEILKNIKIEENEK